MKFPAIVTMLLSFAVGGTPAHSAPPAKPVAAQTKPTQKATAPKPAIPKRAAAKAPATKTPASKTAAVQRKRGKSKPKKNQKPDEQHHTVIESISSDSITVKADKDSTTYNVTTRTEIEIKGQKATFIDLKVGMRVSVTLATDGVTTARISANDAPSDKPSAAKSDSPKKSGKGKGR